MHNPPKSLVIGLTAFLAAAWTSEPASYAEEDLPIWDRSESQEVAQYDSYDSFEDEDRYKKKKKKKKRKKRKKRRKRRKKKRSQSRSSQHDLSIGGGLGVMIPSLSGFNTGLSGGLNGAYRLSKEWELEAFGILYVNTVTAGTTETQSTLIPFGLGLNYLIDDFYIGGRGGLVVESVKVTTSTTSVTLSESELMLGGKAGYDYPLSKSFTLGGEGGLNYVLGDPQAYTLLTLFATLKYRW